MSKYWHTLKMQLEDSLSYRFNFLSTGVYLVLPLVSHLFIWIAMYRSGVSQEQMGGYSLPMIMTYTILGHYVDKHTNEVLLQLKISKEIRDGLISRYLVQPVNSYVLGFFTHLAYTFITFITITPVYLILIAITHKSFIFDGSLVKWMSILANFLIAVIIGFLLNHIIGALTFWLKDVMSIYIFTQSTFLFLSGGYLPLDLLPKAVYEFLLLTPFPYLLFFPVSIYVKSYSIDFILKHMLIGVTWVLILGAVSYVIYESGLKEYEASGI